MTLIPSSISIIVGVGCLLILETVIYYSYETCEWLEPVMLSPDICELELEFKAIPKKVDWNRWGSQTSAYIGDQAPSGDQTPSGDPAQSGDPDSNKDDQQHCYLEILSENNLETGEFSYLFEFNYSLWKYQFWLHPTPGFVVRIWIRNIQRLAILFSAVVVRNEELEGHM